MYRDRILPTTFPASPASACLTNKWNVQGWNITNYLSCLFCCLYLPLPASACLCLPLPFSTCLRCPLSCGPNLIHEGRRSQKSKIYSLIYLSPLFTFLSFLPFLIQFSHFSTLMVSLSKDFTTKNIGSIKTVHRERCYL